MYRMHEWHAQADAVILTNDSPGAKAPQVGSNLEVS